MNDADACTDRNLSRLEVRERCFFNDGAEFFGSAERIIFGNAPDEEHDEFLATVSRNEIFLASVGLE